MPADTNSRVDELTPPADRAVGARRSVIFTIVSANYIGYAATLMQSVAIHNPSADRYIILSDTRHEFVDVNLSATLMTCDELGVPEIANMKAWYTVIEFNTAVKPFALTYFFESFLHISRAKAFLAACIFYGAWLASVLSPGENVFWLVIILTSATAITELLSFNGFDNLTVPLIALLILCLFRR